MPDRKFTYQIEIDATQARTAAQQLRRVFEQEMRTINVSGGGAGGVSNRGAGGGLGGGMLAGALGAGFAGLGAGMVAGRVLGFAKELNELNRAARLANAGLVQLVGSQREAAARAEMVQEAMGNTVSRIEAMQTATKLAALGFADTRQEMERFLRVSQGISAATGQTTDYVTQQLGMAISNQSIMRLDQLGLGVSEVKERIAELTKEHADWSKEMIFSEALLGRSEEKYGALADAAKDNASGIAQFSAALTDLKTSVSAVGGPLDTAASGAAGFVRGMVDAKESGDLLSGMIKSSDPALEAYRDRLFEIARAAQAAGGMTAAMAGEVAGLNAMLRGAPGRQTAAPGGAGMLPGVLGGGFDPLTGYGQGGASSFYQKRRYAQRFAGPLDESNTPGSFGYNQFFGQLSADNAREQQKLMEQTASKAANEWERAADEAAGAWEKAAQAFENKLRRVPGLMGTSGVTQQQMDLAAMGVPQNFADTYLREVEDEVRNKVDRPGVSLSELAGLAGIDQGLPEEAQLILARQKWENSSLFANPDALRLINQDAVRANLAEQQAGEAGQANILKLFGLDEEMDDAGKQKLLGVGVNVIDEIYRGFSDQAIAKDWAGAFLNGLLAQAQGISSASPSAPQAPLGDLSGALGIIP